MTHEDVCKRMHNKYLCGTCRRKRAMSYIPIRNEAGDIVDFQDVKTACFYRTPMNDVGVDNKWGLHSITPPEKCDGYERASDQPSK